jgi:hypothetical protein
LKTKTEEIKSKPNEFYKVFKPIINTKAKGNDKQHVTLETDGAIISDQKTVANHFVDYFASVAKNIGDPELLALTAVVQKCKTLTQKPKHLHKSQNTNTKFKTLTQKPKH